MVSSSLLNHDRLFFAFVWSMRFSSSTIRWSYSHFVVKRKCLIIWFLMLGTTVSFELCETWTSTCKYPKKIKSEVKSHFDDEVVQELMRRYRETFSEHTDTVLIHLSSYIHFRQTEEPKLFLLRVRIPSTNRQAQDSVSTSFTNIKREEDVKPHEDDRISRWRLNKFCHCISYSTAADHNWWHETWKLQSLTRLMRQW